jgi:hypothetical protein
MRVWAATASAVICAGLVVLSGCGSQSKSVPGTTAASPRHKLWETRRPPRDGVVEATPPGPSEYVLLGGSRVYRHWAAGRLTLVYSGALTQKQSQGIVYVVDYAYPLRVSLVPDSRDLTRPDASKAGVYLTPIQVGGVWIAGYQGDILTLISSDRHHRMTFDLRTRRFRVL